MIRAALAAALLAALVLPAAADPVDVLPSDLWDTWQNAPPGQDEKTEPEDDALSAAYCDRYGPGYELVPGTATCIRASGYVQMDVYTRGRR